MQTSNTFSILFWPNKAKKKNGLIPIYARVTVNGKRAEISLKRSVSVTCAVTSWDTKSGRLTSRSPESRALNAYLDATQADLYDCYQQLKSSRKLVTARAIKNLFVGEDDDYHTLVELIHYHNTRMKTVLAPSTMKNYYTTERYIKLFLQKMMRSDDVYLQELSYRFIADFEYFLRTTSPINEHQPLNNNGTMKHLERLKKLINLALKMEWIVKDPFIRYKLKYDRYERVYLNASELEKLESITLEKQGHCVVRDIFVFCCYTGLSYVDVEVLSDRHIVRGIDGKHWISTQRQKSQTPVKIPLLDKALEILKRYDTVSGKGDKLLPVYSNPKTNSYLKEIMELCGIDKHISFHAARHTFATTVTLSNGVPIETVSKLLGHTKLSTTQIYARVLETKIHEDMKQLATKLNPKPEETESKVSLNQ